MAPNAKPMHLLTPSETSAMLEAALYVMDMDTRRKLMLRFPDAYARLYDMDAATVARLGAGYATQAPVAAQLHG